MEQPIITTNWRKNTTTTTTTTTILQRGASDSERMEASSSDDAEDSEGHHVVALRDRDVLLGRSKLAFEHNTHFHLLIAEHSQAYLDGSRHAKSNLVLDLKQDIQSDGGRFLRKSKKSGHWFVVSERVAREKVSSVVVPLLSFSLVVLQEKKDSFFSFTEARYNGQY